MTRGLRSCSGRKETNELLEEGTTLIFIELKKFSKSLKECGTEKDRWICSLKSMGEQLEMPKELSGTIFQTLYDKAALVAMSPEQRTIYISKTMSRNDELNSRAEMIEDALQEGYAKGLNEGLAEGIMKGREDGRTTEKLQNAQKMKALGIDVEIIMQVTGLDKTSINNL